jgi:CheY-like chemotaxis protein/HPt (histidine-containing phosphotransfer) domain-containing protein
VRVEAVDSGRQALGRLRAPLDRTAFDLVVLDMMMPEMDGLELARVIRADPGLAGLQLVLLTSAAGSGKEDVLSGLVDAVLTKPARAAELRSVLARRQSDHPGPRPRLEGKPQLSGHVLLVEDNVVNQEVALAFLSSLGCTATLANNGREAVEFATRDSFGLILMDCMMPEMDGFQATAAIRALEATARTRRTPIVALTAAAVDGERQRCLDSGMDDFLAKPITQGRLREVLERWLLRELDCTPPVSVRVEAPSAPRPSDGLNPEALDRLRLHRTSAGPSLLVRAASAYLRDAPTQIEAMRRGLTEDKGEDVRRLAHTLKSSSLMLGAEELAHLCLEMEELAQESGSCRAAQFLPTIEGEFARVERALEDLLELEASHA